MMENSVSDLFHFNDNLKIAVGSIRNSNYVSCIKIHGKPIIPPLITEEKRNELKKYKEKAIAVELRLAKLRKKNSIQVTSDISSIETLPPSRQSTPARPITLNLGDKCPGKTYVLSKSKTDGSLDQYSNNFNGSNETTSSQKSKKSLNKAFRSTLEQRLASEDNDIVENKVNKYQQSPIIEEHYSEKVLDSNSDSNEERILWSPLKTDQLSSLRIELLNKDLQKTNEAYIDDSQNTPETVTQSPSLMRQNSYTLLTPSPALISYLENHKQEEIIQRSQSGRKTWDFTEAKRNWVDADEKQLLNSPAQAEESNDESQEDLNNKESNSLENCTVLQLAPDDDTNFIKYSKKNFNENDTGSNDSFASNSKKITSEISKIKSIVTKSRSLKSVPSPKKINKTDEVPFRQERYISTQVTPDFVPSNVDNELSELSNMLMKMKFDHERQKKELEEKQQSEMKQLEIIFQRKEAELLNKVHNLPKKSSKSIYSQTSTSSAFTEPDIKIMGDNSYNSHNIEKDYSNAEQYLSNLHRCRRPHSAKDFHHQTRCYENDYNRRTKSMDFNTANQDTDLDVSFQDEFLNSTRESDSMSNFSSRSSTVSSENRPDVVPVTFRRYQGIPTEEYAKYSQAATLITAAVRGFLVRRLLQTAYVQGLITTLKDAIACATQLHTASDISDSDIDLMRRLGRQIEAAWDAVYGVFFNLETTAKLQLIAADRERLRAAVTKTPKTSSVKKKRISSATKKSLDRKKGVTLMSKSQTTNGCTRVRLCSKMAASYPNPYMSQKLK